MRMIDFRKAMNRLRKALATIGRDPADPAGRTAVAVPDTTTLPANDLETTARASVQPSIDGSRIEMPAESMAFGPWFRALTPALRSQLHDSESALRMFELDCSLRERATCELLEQFVALVPNWAGMHFRFARLLLRHMAWAAQGRELSPDFKEMVRWLNGGPFWPAGLALNWTNARRLLEDARWDQGHVNEPSGHAAHLH